MALLDLASFSGICFPPPFVLGEVLHQGPICWIAIEIRRAKTLSQDPFVLKLAGQGINPATMWWMKLGRNKGSGV